MIPSDQAKRVLDALKRHPTLLYKLKRQMREVHVLTEWTQNDHEWWARYEGSRSVGHVYRKHGVYIGKAELENCGKHSTLRKAASTVDEKLREMGFLLCGEDGLEVE